MNETTTRKRRADTHRRILFALLLSGFAAAAGAVPAPREQRLASPPDRGIGAGETIRILSLWDRSGYVLTADFAALDGGSGSVAVVDSANGSYLIAYTTGTMVGQSEAAGIVVPITARDPADNSTFSDRSLVVCRRHLSLPPIHLSTRIEGDSIRFRPGNTLRIRTAWAIAPATGYRIAPDFRSLVPDFRESEAQTEIVAADTISADRIEITTRVTYRIPGQIRLVPERNGIPLRLLARDNLCSRIAGPDLLIDLRTSSPPSPREQIVVAPRGRGVREGDTVEILSRWDAGGYTLRPDFRSLDGGLGGEAAVIDSSTIDPDAAGSYLIRYTPGPIATLPDSRFVVPITATDPLGDSVTDRTLILCRNHGALPPVHLGTQLRGQRRVFRTSDSLIVLTRWESPENLPLTVEADYRELAPGFAAHDARVTRRGVDTFRVAYKIPMKESLVPDARGIRLTVLARDALCSETRYDSLFIDLDTTPPPSPPVFDPLPPQTNTTPIIFSGTAVEAASVAIFRNDVIQFVVPVGEGGRFSTEVGLVAGNNKLGGYSQDELGNKTVLGSSKNILYVPGKGIAYPTPFRKGNAIVIQDAGGLSEAEAAIYNLEGDLIQRIDGDGPAFEIRLAWDGKDHNGDRAQPGYYLMRIRSVSADGRATEETRPLLYRSD